MWLSRDPMEPGGIGTFGAGNPLGVSLLHGRIPLMRLTETEPPIKNRISALPSL